MRAALSGSRIRAEPSPALGHLGHRAAHVDVDDVRPGLLQGQGGPLFHTGLVAAKDLDGGGPFPRPQLQQGGGLFIPIAQGLGADHLSDGVAAGQLPAHGAEGQVGHPGHGGQGDLGI